MLSFSLTFLFYAASVLAQNAPTGWTASPFNPPAVPLFVKSPYVNAWMQAGNGSEPLDSLWPTTWDGTGNILGWYASVRVDGTPYVLLGNTGIPGITHASQKSFVFTTTQTSYLLQAGSVNINMTFLSPIEPSDLVRQSMPFAYLSMTAESNDGNTHDVQVYSDVSGEWLSGDNTLVANWTINESTDFVYLQMDLSTPGPYQEISNRAQDSTLYYCMEKSDKVSWQNGNADDIRTFFANGTGLDKTTVATPHALSVPWVNLGLAYNFGNISSTSEAAVFALGVVRDPVIRYTNGNVQTEERRAYYWSKFSDIHDVIDDVLGHFEDAVTNAAKLDNQILGAAGGISSNYADILSLSTRQAFGALEYTLVKDGGSLNTSDIKTFMKNMGDIGSGQVNAVDVLYAAMPAYLYLNPNTLGYLLSPLMTYQESTQYTNAYAALDLGGPFPNATGNYDGHDQKIEQSANMIIMSLAHAQASGDGSLLTQHYRLLNSWANYLVNNTMNPGDQTTSSSDGVTSSSQTNLVLKGIIGIGAMAKIAGYTGNAEDNSRLDGIVQDYVQQLDQLSTGSNGLDLNFGGSSSGVIYNLYADKILQLNLFNSSVYDLQTSFYKQQSALWKYGIPLDSSNSSVVSRSDWMLLAAASASDFSVRDSMISQVHLYVSANLENKPFPILYNASNGSQIGGESSPAQGAMFAPLALTVPIQSVTFTGGSRGTGGSNTGIIVGATVGGVALLAIVAGVLIFWRRRRRGQKDGTDRIERVKPTSIHSDPVLEPLSATMYPDMSNLAGAPHAQYENGSGSFVVSSAHTQSARVPFHVRNLADSEAVGAGEGSRVSGIASPSGLGSSSGRASAVLPPPPRAKADDHRDELRSEVDDLRREIERMREERITLGEAPPSYDEEIARLTGPR